MTALVACLRCSIGFASAVDADQKPVAAYNSIHTAQDLEFGFHVHASG